MKRRSFLQLFGVAGAAAAAPTAALLAASASPSSLAQPPQLPGLYPGQADYIPALNNLVDAVNNINSALARKGIRI
jgi:hypothetical protein